MANSEQASPGLTRTLSLMAAPLLDVSRCHAHALRRACIRSRSLLSEVGLISAFAMRAIRLAFQPPFELREVIHQVYMAGWRSLPLVMTSGLAIGVVLSMHTRATMERFGAEALIPAALAIVMISETGPLMTGLLVSGRVGAGIGAELGGMKVTEQIDALESLAVDSFHYLVVTRIMACMIALPILTTVMNFSGLIGGFLAETVISHVSLRLYFHQAFAGIGFMDYLLPTLKTVVFGFIIGTVSSYLGYTTSGGSEGIGRASTRSVVFSSMLLIVINVLLVRLIFVLFPVGAL
jgi:phospholipid/cholesterol/gamma-HCH transport system permease protein